MGKVFAITKGEYSDYSIVGIFSTKAKAERALRELDIYGKNDYIEEYELDELDTLVNKFNRGYRVFRVYMQSDGATTDVYRENSIDTWINHSKNKNMLWGQVLAKSEEHAVKIVNEKRVQLIAAGEL